MKDTYKRLRNSLTLYVIGGMLLAEVVGLSLLHLLLFALRDPVARLLVWLMVNTMGYTLEGALATYDLIVHAVTPILTIAVGLGIMLLCTFYMSHKLFTWMNLIGDAMRQVSAGGEVPKKFPRLLSPILSDLEAMSQNLADRDEDAKKAEQRQSDLVAYVAHDLKTPLTSVLGYLQLLADSPNLPSEQREDYTKIALSKAQRLQRLVAEFFDFSRLEVSQGQKELLHLPLLVEQVVEETYPLFSQQSLTCTIQIQPGIVVRGDPERLARVYDNLLRNAANYATPGTIVELGGKVVDGIAQLWVTNEGQSIPEQELAKIFHKFYRLDQSRSPRVAGAGLGLAIVREIVHAHGGEVAAESDGRRTTFSFTIPLAGE